MRCTAPRSRLLLVGRAPRAGNAPWEPPPQLATLWAMNLILLIVILFLLFGGGGFYFGGPAFGGGGLGLVLLICLIIYFLGGFRSKN